jgi:cyclic pyranopterin phosphate synthase
MSLSLTILSPAPPHAGPVDDRAMAIARGGLGAGAAPATRSIVPAGDSSGPGQPNAMREPAAPRPAPGHITTLIDSLGRPIRDLRVSITDRCNFRCVYCLEPDARFMPSAELLTPEEFARVARIATGLGVRTLRITGGEPTVHPQLTRIISLMAGAGAQDVAMTTNGSRCDDASLRAWRDAGLHRLTISLDSLQPGRFSAITRSTTEPREVVGAIRRALSAGFAPVKVNAVIVRGFNEDEVPDLAALAHDFGIDMRFIEYMPLDSGRAWEPTKLVPAAEILERIRTRFDLVEMERLDLSSTSRDYAFAGGARGSIGLIAPVTRPFCGACSRLRVTADGKVRPCLFSLSEWDISHMLRSNATDGQIAQRLIDITWTKQAGHTISDPSFAQPSRSMSAIGG